MILLIIPTVVLLLIVFYQDLKYRGVTWFLFPILTILLFLISFSSKNLSLILEHTLINLSFLAIQLVLVFLYLTIKKRKLIKNFEDYFGLGDLLYLIVICIFLSPLNYFFYYTISLLLSLGMTSLFLIVRKDNTWVKIPLAGLQSLFLAFLIITDLFKEGMSLIYDDHLISYIIY